MMTQPPSLTPEAIEFQTDPMAIEERRVPALARATVHVVFLILLVAIIWAAVSRIDRIVSATGKIITDSPLIVLQTVETSPVRQVTVEVGKVVREGEILATLDPTFTGADLADLSSRLDSVAAEADRLEHELFGHPLPPPSTPHQRLQYALLEKRQSQFQSTLAELDARRTRLEAEIRGAALAQAGLTRRLEVLGEVETMRSDLAERQVASRLQVLDARYNRLSLADELARERDRTDILEAQLTEVAASRARFETEWRRGAMDDLLRVQRERDSLREQLAKADRRNALTTLRAPADAVVLDIAQRRLGSVLQAAEPFITLVPLNVGYEVEVEIAARDIGQIRLNDPVRIKLEALPFQRHGTLSGVVRVISEDAFIPPPERGGGPVFRARIAITDRKLRNIPDDFRLIPGMTTTAEIRIGDRTVISYLLYPVLRVFDESLREP